MAQKRANRNDWNGIGHSRIRWEVTDSPAWRVLSYSAKALYADLRATVRQTNNGNIDCTLSVMKHKGWRSQPTLTRALRQLEVLGFIAKTRQGGIAALSKHCSLFRFTDLPVYEQPKQGVSAKDATHDYRRFESVREANAALRSAALKKSKVQKLNQIGKESESIGPFIDTESEQEPPAKGKKLNKENRAAARATYGKTPQCAADPH